jgi:hypothetical protein
MAVGMLPIRQRADHYRRFIMHAITLINSTGMRYSLDLYRCRLSARFADSPPNKITRTT